MQKNRMLPGILLLAAWLGGPAAVPAAEVQPAVRKVDNRFLLIFDTSSEMKRRVTAVQNALNVILATSASGQLHSNDTVGVWTFDQQLQTGQYPLQHWNPDQAVTIASGINKFVDSRRYAKKTTFDVLFPLLDQVVQGSQRLTVVIFCDGYGEIHGTPYDQGINQLFQQRQAERQKSRQPIVIVLHSQLGQYVDCMVSFPPQPVSIPEFPPLPAPAPPPKPAAAPPRPSVPPLIIIGTPVTNRAPPPVSPPVRQPAPTNPAPTNLPPITIPAAPPAAAPEAKPPDNAPPTRPVGAPSQLKIDAGLLPQTNAVSASRGNSGFSQAEAFAVGAAFLVVAGLLVFLFGRTRTVKKE